MMLSSIIIMLLSPKITHANEKVICQNSASFVTKEFICGTILVSLILSSLFCYISISPSIFMHTYGLSTFSYSIIFSFSVLFFIIGNQLSKIEKLSNLWFLLPNSQFYRITNKWFKNRICRIYYRFYSNNKRWYNQFPVSNRKRQRCWSRNYFRSWFTNNFITVNSRNRHCRK